MSDDKVVFSVNSTETLNSKARNLLLLNFSITLVVTFFLIIYTKSNNLYVFSFLLIFPISHLIDFLISKRKNRNFYIQLTNRCFFIKSEDLNRKTKFTTNLKVDFDDETEFCYCTYDPNKDNPIPELLFYIRKNRQIQYLIKVKDVFYSLTHFESKLHDAEITTRKIKYYDLNIDLIKSFEKKHPEKIFYYNK